MHLTDIKNNLHGIHEIIQKMMVEDDTRRRIDLIRLYCIFVVIITSLMIVLNIVQEEYVFVVALSVFVALTLLIL